MFKRIGTLLLLAGCAKNPVSTSPYKNPFESSGQKVHLTQKTFAAGTSLALLMDETCLISLSITQEQKPTLLLNEEVIEEIQALHPPFFSRSQEQTHLVVLNQPATIEEIKNSANSHPCILGVSQYHQITPDEASVPSEMHPIRPLNFNDPMLDKQAHLGMIEAQESYKIFFNPVTGIQKEMIIAIVDTGIDLNHTDLKDNLWTNEKEQNGKPNVDDDNDGFIDDIHGYNFGSKIGDPSHQTLNDHGTHVAGLAGAILSNGVGGAGVMGEKVRIMALNIFGKSWNAETADMDTAIRYAADHGAHVINVSLGGSGPSETTAAAIVYALNHGSIVVTSAGNLQQDIGDHFYFPASYAPQYPGLISVAATVIGSGTICDFSNFSSKVVKIAAPGCDTSAPRSGLFSTLSKDQYGYKRGTSMSAPLVSGAIALAYGLIRDRSQQPVSIAQVEEIFLKVAFRNSALDTFILEGRALNLKRLAEEIDRTFPFQTSTNPLEIPEIEGN